MDTQVALSEASRIAQEVIAPKAPENDESARFPTEAIEALGTSGLLGLVVPEKLGGSGLGPRAFLGVTAALAQADASVGMIYNMHVCGTMCLIAASGNARVEPELRSIAAGEHLTTLAFSEKGSRSHFWAPVSRAVAKDDGVRVSALKSWVTSAHHADSYVISVQAPGAKEPTESTLYLVRRDAPGVRVSDRWNGMGLRANDSAPVTLEDCHITDDKRLTEPGAGFKAMLETVLPFFNLGSAAVSLGLCRAAVAATATHLKTAKFEHLGASLGEALPNLRATLANMQIEADGLAARLADVVAHLEAPNDTTVLRVLESKAAGGEAAIRVTSDAMRACGGAAFSNHTGVSRIFRDAHAGAVMAPTTDVLRDFIGKAVLGLPLF